MAPAGRRPPSGEQGGGAVVVTGAGGYVGSAVLRALVAAVEQRTLRLPDGAPAGHVVGIVRPGSPARRLAELDPSPAWSVLPVDLADRAATLDALAAVRPRAIVHAAFDRRLHLPLGAAERRRLAVEPLGTLCRALAGTQAAVLLHTSSAWVLGPGERLDEGAAVAPWCPYGEAKADEEEALPRLAGDAGVGWSILRLFNLFGRHEDEGRLVPYLVRRLAEGAEARLSSGEQVRDFTDVDDVARAYVLALQAAPAAWGTLYNVGSGRPTTVATVARLVAGATGAGHLLRFGTREAHDPLPCQVADPSRAARALGWRAGPLEDRLREVVGWWLARLRGVPVVSRRATG